MVIETPLMTLVGGHTKRQTHAHLWNNVKSINTQEKHAQNLVCPEEML